MCKLNAKAKATPIALCTCPETWGSRVIDDEDKPEHAMPIKGKARNGQDRGDCQLEGCTSETRSQFASPRPTPLDTSDTLIYTAHRDPILATQPTTRLPLLRFREPLC